MVGVVPCLPKPGVLCPLRQASQLTPRLPRRSGRRRTRRRGCPKISTSSRTQRGGCRVVRGPDTGNLSVTGEGKRRSLLVLKAQPQAPQTPLTTRKRRPPAWRPLPNRARRRTRQVSRDHGSNRENPSPKRKAREGRTGSRCCWFQSASVVVNF